MQTGDSCAAFIVRKDEEIAAFRVHRGVIRGGNPVFAAIAGPNSEWNKWRAVKQLSNTGDHDAILSHAGIQLNLVDRRAIGLKTEGREGNEGLLSVLK